MRRIILLLYAGLIVLIPAVAHAQLSTRANRNLETFLVAGSTGLGKAEDGAHTSGDTGVMMLCVRNDTHTNALSGTDGDYTPCATDSTGKLGMRGTFAEDAGHTSGDLGFQVLTVRQDTAAALAGTDADYQPLITDSTGRLHTNTEMPNAAALADAASAAPTTPTVGAIPLLMNATTVDRQRAVIDGLNSVGTGIAAVGIVGQLDDTASSAVTENQFAAVRITPVRDLRTAATNSTTPADGQANTGSFFRDQAGNTNPTGTLPYLFNATTWDRQRSVVTGTDSIGTGIAAVGLIAQLDDTSPSTVTENQFGSVRLSPRRALYVEDIPTAPDPCKSSVAKSSVVVNVTTDAQLIALSGSTVIYVCGFSVSIAGTSPTMRLISGTGTVCATGLAGRTGAYAPLTGSMITAGYGTTALQTAAGEALCMDTEGTTPSVQGVLTYVQQ
mgnify:CR=1 FL=1